MTAGSGETLSPRRGSGGSAPGLFRLGLLFAGFIFVFDQLSKWLILDVLLLAEVQHIPLLAFGPFGLDLTMVWNRGMTFGLFSGDGPWNHLILAGLAVAIAIFLLRWLAWAEGRMVALALGAVIGAPLAMLLIACVLGRWRISWIPMPGAGIGMCSMWRMPRLFVGLGRFCWMPCCRHAKRLKITHDSASQDLFACFFAAAAGRLWGEYGALAWLYS